MNAEKYVNSIDWVFYLEREQTIFLSSAFSWAYGPMMEDATGFSFKHQLTKTDSRHSFFYRDPEELHESVEHFGSLIDDEDTIRAYLGKEREAHSLAEEEFEDILELIPVLQEILLWNTLIPYRLLAALPEGHELLHELEKIRGNSIYPTYFEEKVMPLLLDYARKNSIPGEICANLTVDEVISGELPTMSELERRKSCYFYFDDSNRVFFGRIPKLERDELPEDEITGTVAFEGGVVEGKVRIVNSVTQMDAFEEGEIMVSIQSNPSLMPAVRKASALVTNEGGALCHAAIVSRELEIPCVIGTGDATRIFKDGDTVCVNTRTGKVSRS